MKKSRMYGDRFEGVVLQNLKKKNNVLKDWI